MVTINASLPDLEKAWAPLFYDAFLKHLLPEAFKRKQSLDDIQL
jgi:hypothetical protein